jgi:hypothetical protein
MKKISLLFTLLLVLLLPLTINGKTVKTVDVTAGTSLESLLGSDKLNIDSLIITGNLAATDFKTLADCCYKGKLTGINLAGCSIENNAIPKSAFATDKNSPKYNLEYVTLPASLKTIGISAFYCTGLKCIEIPAAVTKIGMYAFWGCKHLSGSVTIPEGITAIEDITFTYCNLSEVKLPSKLTIINQSAFAQNPSLTHIDLPATLTTIERYTFANTGLCEIVFPESIKTVSVDAFRECRSLTKVYIKTATVPSSMDNVGFSGSPFGSLKTDYKVAQNATLYVPIGAKPNYEADSYWKEFKEIIETSNFPSGISQTNIDSPEYQVVGSKGEITISASTVSTGRAYNIYSFDGKLLSNGTISGDAVTVAVPAGFYIVSIAGNATKVMVK